MARALVVVIAALAIVAAPMGAAAAAEWQSVGWVGSGEPLAVNDQGQVVGRTYERVSGANGGSYPSYTPWTWSVADGRVDLPHLDAECPISVPWGIANSGDIGGVSCTGDPLVAGDQDRFPVVWHQRHIRNLGAPAVPCQNTNSSNTCSGGSFQSGQISAVAPGGDFVGYVRSGEGDRPIAGPITGDWAYDGPADGAGVADSDFGRVIAYQKPSRGYTVNGKALPNPPFDVQNGQVLSGPRADGWLWVFVQEFGKDLWKDGQYAVLKWPEGSTPNVLSAVSQSGPMFGMAVPAGGSSLRPVIFESPRDAGAWFAFPQADPKLISGNGSWMVARDGTVYHREAGRKVAGRVEEVSCGESSCRVTPLAGVTITVQGTSKSATTAADGRYEISGLAAEAVTVAPKLDGALVDPQQRALDLRQDDARDVDFRVCRESGGAQVGLSGARFAAAAGGGCLAVDVTTGAPNEKAASAGDTVKYSLVVRTARRAGQVRLSADLPAARLATLVPNSLTGGGRVEGGRLIWTLDAATLGPDRPTPVTFSLKVTKKPGAIDPENDRKLALPVQSYRLSSEGAAAGPAVGLEHRLDLLPCGSDAADVARSFRVRRLGWRMSVEVDPLYGLALDDLVLEGGRNGDRQFINRISVPYMVVSTSTSPRKITVRLRPEAEDATGRSRLLSLDRTAAEHGLEAVYAIDRIGSKSKSCLVVTVRYQFRAYGADDSCHPVIRVSTLARKVGIPFLAKCAQFRPLLSYEFRGVEEELAGIQVAQRMRLNFDGAARSASLVRDRDNPFWGLGAGRARANPVVVREISPLGAEALHPAISGDGGRSTDWDNFHQSPESTVDLPGDADRGLAVACAECFHSHWRWGKPITLVPLGRNLGGGAPLIPTRSTQTARVGILQARPGEEGKPVGSLLSGGRVDPSKLAFYWLSDNRGQQKDDFHFHWLWTVTRRTPRPPARPRRAKPAGRFAGAGVRPLLCSIPT